MNYCKLQWFFYLMTFEGIFWRSIEFGLAKVSNIYTFSFLWTGDLVWKEWMSKEISVRKYFSNKSEWFRYISNFVFIFVQYIYVDWFKRPWQHSSQKHFKHQETYFSIVLTPFDRNATKPVSDRILHCTQAYRCHGLCNMNQSKSGRKRTV